ncbi:MAG: endoglucanase [Myxococcales bacterium]|nr:MAG: endoglucanase [Myxococcales bacterium]
MEPTAGSPAAAGSSGGGGVENVGAAGAGGQPPSGAGSGGVANGGSAAQGEGGGGAGQSAAGAGGLSGAAGSGGSTGTGTGGSNGGAGSYNPCPTDGSVCKILPFGDSITRGAKSSDDGGYRKPLYALILAAKQNATFTGSQAHGPAEVSGQPFPRKHEGHAGWTIDPGYNMISSSYSGISTLVPSPALKDSPHIILLMIGTNDLFARDTANMAARLDVLLDKVAENAPKALVVLAQLTPLGHDDPNLTAYNAKLPALVQSHAAKGQHIIGVDMSKLPTRDLADGTHPNDRGYAYMANVWYAAIKDSLPVAP